MHVSIPRTIPVSSLQMDRLVDCLRYRLDLRSEIPGELTDTTGHQVDVCHDVLLYLVNYWVVAFWEVLLLQTVFWLTFTSNKLFILKTVVSVMDSCNSESFASGRWTVGPAWWLHLLDCCSCLIVASGWLLHLVDCCIWLTVASG